MTVEASAQTNVDRRPTGVRVFVDPLSTLGDRPASRMRDVLDITATNRPSWNGGEIDAARPGAPWAVQPRGHFPMSEPYREYHASRSDPSRLAAIAVADGRRALTS